jgi:site-specific recombinase XerD
MACEKLPRSANRNIAMINFMLDSGVRVSELCGIKMSNVDFLHNKVLILGKGNKERYVYFSDRTKARLEVYFRNRNDMDTNNFNELCFKYADLPLFASCDKHCRCMNKGSVESMLKTIGKNAGIERLHPHLLRATFATNLAKRGVSTSAIAKALGHANLNTIHRYILLSDDQVSTSLRSVGFGS